jgi:hypothetical protein
LNKNDTPNPQIHAGSARFLQFIYIFYRYLLAFDDIYFALGHSWGMTPKPARQMMLKNFYAAVEDYERKLISDALMQTRGNQARAARILGLNPTTLSSQLRRLRIDARSFKQQEVAIPLEAFERLWLWRSRGS